MRGNTPEGNAAKPPPAVVTRHPLAFPPRFPHSPYVVLGAQSDHDSISHKRHEENPTRWIPMTQRLLIRWCAVTLLVIPISSAMAATAQAPGQAGTPPSAMTIHIPIPVTPLAELYGNLSQQLATQRNRGHDWVTLGGGSGFLKYRLWPHEQGSTTTEDRLLSHSTVPFGVEYGKHIKGSITKIAECGQRDVSAGTGDCRSQWPRCSSRPQLYGTSHQPGQRRAIPTQSCLLSEQGVDASPLMAQVYRSDLQEVLPAIDRKASGLVTIKPAVARIWNDLQEPLLLDETEQLWLALNPESTAVAESRRYPVVPQRVMVSSQGPRSCEATKPIPRLCRCPNRRIAFMTTAFMSISHCRCPSKKRINGCGKRSSDRNGRWASGRSRSSTRRSIHWVIRWSRIDSSRTIAADPAPQGDTGL